MLYTAIYFEYKILLCYVADISVSIYLYLYLSIYLYQEVICPVDETGI
jgi:hypothetical protein